MKHCPRTVLKLSLFEMFFFTTSKDILFAQQFDLPPHSLRDTVTRAKEHNGMLTLRQLLDAYPLQATVIEDQRDKHEIKNYTAKELEYLLIHEIPFEYISKFSSIRNQKDKPLFGPRDIAKFHQNDITVQDLEKGLRKIEKPVRKELLNKLYLKKYKTWKKKLRGVPRLFLSAENFRTLYSLSLVKRSYDFFRESVKPNLVITYPQLDNNRAFFSPSARELIKTLSGTYNVWLATIGDDHDLGRVIKKVPDIKLLIVSGHGQRDRIILDQPLEGFEELSYIDVNDKELKRRLKKLPSDGVIFLNACSVGSGRDSMQNLANTIAGFVPGRKVISATTPYDMSEIKINRNYPFDIDIPGKIYMIKK
jgi:hypothetical protein